MLDGGQRSDYALHTTDAQRNTITHGGLRIRLAELQPYPFSNRQIGQADDRASFIVAPL